MKVFLTDTAEVITDHYHLLSLYCSVGYTLCREKSVYCFLCTTL